jgi:hypothetical protein
MGSGTGLGDNGDGKTVNQTSRYNARPRGIMLQKTSDRLAMDRR